MPDQFNLLVIWSKSALFVIHFNGLFSDKIMNYIVNYIDCVAAQKLHVFMQSRPVLTVKNTFYIEINAVI